MLGPRELMHPPFAANTNIGFRDAIAYAPDGLLLAFTADSVTDNVFDLFVLDPLLPPPAPQTRITPDAALGAGVDRFLWSPDSARIAYVADRETANMDELYIHDLATQTSTRVHTPLAMGERIGDERWIIGGSKMLYTVTGPSGRRLFVTDVSGPPGTPVELGFVGGFPIRPTFDLSPDGTRAVFADQEAPQNIYLADLAADPPTAVLLTRSSPVASWCWKPTGELAVVGEDGHLYYIEDIEQPELFQISGPLVAGGQVVACAFPPR